MSEKAPYNPDTPYNDLPLLAPQAEIENTTILKKKRLLPVGHGQN